MTQRNSPPSHCPFFFFLGPHFLPSPAPSDHTPPVPVALIGSVWKSRNPHLTATGDSLEYKAESGGCFAYSCSRFWERRLAVAAVLFLQSLLSPAAKDHLLTQTRGGRRVTFLLAFPTNKALFSAHARLFFQLLSNPAAAVAPSRLQRSQFFFFLFIPSKLLSAVTAGERFRYLDVLGRCDLFGFLIIV